MKYKANILNGDYFGSDVINLDFPCEIHFTRFGDKQYKTNIVTNENLYENINFVNKQNYKVFVCSNEPTTSASRELTEVIINNSFQYDLILTSQKEIIENTTNAVFFPYGTTWLNKNKQLHSDCLGSFDESLLDQMPGKFFNISFVTTGRRQKEGYEHRHHIWNNRSIIRVPTTFYSSTRDHTRLFGYSDTFHDGMLPNDDKMNLFKSQFSIAIESTKEDSYFTEKLIDCLLTKTVPIYWGASNIGEFFDTRGFIIFNNLYEFYEKVNSLTPKTYESMKPYIDANYEKAKEYGRSFFSRIQEKIEEQYKKQTENTDILWTIGILSVENQRQRELKRLISFLKEITPYRYKNRIEILIESDDGQNTVGAKRNNVLQKAKGKYISFIDDDDMISKSYITKIAEKLETDMYDGISFLGMMYYNKSPCLIFSHANRNTGHYKSDDGTVQYRTLNHLNPVRTNFAKQIKFSEKNHGEDMDYCVMLYNSKLISTEYCFEEIMYHYFYQEPSTDKTKQEKFIIL